MKTIKEVILEVANSRGIPMCANGTTVEFLEECLSRIDAEQSAEIERLTEQVRYMAKSHEINCGLIAEKTDTIAQQAERIAELESKLPLIAKNIAAGVAENSAQAAALAKAREALIAALSDDLPYIVKSKEALDSIDALEQKGCA